MLRIKDLVFLFRTLFQWNIYFHLGSGNSGNIFLQFVSQHCCTTSWNTLLCVSPSAWPTRLAAKYNVAILRRRVAKTRLEFYFLQQILVLLLVLPLKSQLASQKVWIQRLWLSISEARLSGKLKKKMAWNCLSRPRTIGKSGICQQKGKLLFRYTEKLFVRHNIPH